MLLHVFNIIRVQLMLFFSFILLYTSDILDAFLVCSSGFLVKSKSTRLFLFFENPTVLNLVDLNHADLS